MNEQALRAADPAAWFARYETALDGCCARCPGAPIVRRYAGAFGHACHVHQRARPLSASDPAMRRYAYYRCCWATGWQKMQARP